MREQERQGVRPLAPLMHKVNPAAVDLRAKLRELVEVRLLRAPVEVMLPIAGQLPEIRQIGTIVPARSLPLIGPAGASQTRVQVVKGGLRNIDGERLDRHEPRSFQKRR